eukprot:jgi/Psemu1/14484/gm1.14484_g
MVTPPSQQQVIATARAAAAPVERKTETKAETADHRAGTGCHKYFFSDSVVYILYYSEKAQLEILSNFRSSYFQGRSKKHQGRTSIAGRTSINADWRAKPRLKQDLIITSISFPTPLCTFCTTQKKPDLKYYRTSGRAISKAGARSNKAAPLSSALFPSSLHFLSSFCFHDFHASFHFPTYFNFHTSFFHFSTSSHFLSTAATTTLACTSTAAYPSTATSTYTSVCNAPLASTSTAASDSTTASTSTPAPSNSTEDSKSTQASASPAASTSTAAFISKAASNSIAASNSTAPSNSAPATTSTAAFTSTASRTSTASFNSTSHSPSTAAWTSPSALSSQPAVTSTAATAFTPASASTPVSAAHYDSCRPTEVWYCNFLVTVKTYFPHLKPNTPFYAALANVVSPPDNLTRKERKEAAMKSQQVMISILPSLGVFGILHRWSRQAKQKIQFFQDAYNCAIVLQKNSNSTSMVDFFQHIRTWEVQGNYGGRSFSVQYVVPFAQSSQVPENLVAKLEASLCLLYRLLEDAEAGIMHRIRRNSVSTNQEFPIDDGDLTIEGVAMQGFHLPKSFCKCVWFCLQHLHLGFVLYEVIYKVLLIKENVYATGHRRRKQKEVPMQFLIDTCVECPERPSYVTLLAHTCLVFKCVDDVNSLTKDFILAQCIQQSHVELQVKYHTKKASVEFKFQTARYKVFKLWLELKAQEEMKLKVDKLLSADFKTRKQKSTTSSSSQSWDSLIIAPSNYLKQRRVQSFLCICALDHIPEMSFSNPDFYSACGLVNYDHWRSIGCEGSQLTDQFSASNLIKIPSSDIQITAKRCPLGEHLSRDKQFGIPFQNAMGAKSSLFHCVTLVVSQVSPYPCQGKQHPDTLHDSTYAYSQTVVGNWYLQYGKGVFQGGIEPRFQCSSNQKWNAFCTSYCDSNGLVVTTNKDVVDLRLSKILHIGYDLICWMNALKQFGVEHVGNLPIDVIHTKMESAVKRIQSSSGISGFDFGRFYLSQWLTLMIGLALPESGIHLLQLNIPSKGTASFKHFLNPTMRETQQVLMSSHFQFAI